MSTPDLFTVSDQCELARMGIGDVPTQRRQRSAWPAERLLEGARDGALTGPDLSDPDSPDDIGICLDGREISDSEARLFADLIVDGQLVWIGRRIALTADGRALLDRWARYLRLGGGQQ